MKIIQIGDIHTRERDLPEVMRCLETVYQTALEEKPDLIINTGDTFDHRDVRLDSDTAREIFRFFSRLAGIAPIAMLIGTPSHDGQAAKILDHASFGHNVIVSDRPEQLIMIDGEIYRLNNAPPLKQHRDIEAVISMVPTPTKQFWSSESDIKTTDAEISEAMTGMFAGFGAQAAEFECLHILVGHFSVRGAAISATQVMIGREIEIGKEQIALANADLVCLGHIHLQQFIEPNIYYQGSLYRTNYGEVEAKGFMVHDLRPDGRESHFVETPARKLVKNTMDLRDNGGIQEFDAVLYSLVNPDEIRESSVKIEFTVWQDEAEQLDKEEIRQFYLSAGASDVDVRIIRVPRENVRSERMLKLTTLRDKVTERANLNKEPELPESLLYKCDMMEQTDPDAIFTRLAGQTREQDAA